MDELISVIKPFQTAVEAMLGCTISTVKPLLFKLLKIILNADSSTAI